MRLSEFIYIYSVLVFENSQDETHANTLLSHRTEVRWANDLSTGKGNSARISPPSFIHSSTSATAAFRSQDLLPTFALCRMWSQAFYPPPHSLCQFEWLKNNTHSRLKRFFSVETQTKCWEPAIVESAVDVIRLFNDNVKVEFGVSLLEFDEPANAMVDAWISSVCDANCFHLYK